MTDAATAARMRAAAAARPAENPLPVPKRAKASASARSGIAKVGIEQPSTPRFSSFSTVPVVSANAAVICRMVG